MDKLKFKIYRHKIYKDIYLIRNWGVCGTPEANWFKATKSIKEYFNNYESYNGKTLDKAFQERINDKSFTFDRDGKCRTTADITVKKDFNFDGYKGKLEKVLRLPIDEFECIVLKED